MIITIINGVVIEAESLQQAHFECEIKYIRKPYNNAAKASDKPSKRRVKK